MKVIIASTIAPFVRGGSTYIVDSLEQALLRYGHQVEALRFPFDSSYPAMLDQMLGLRLLDVTQHADRLIAIRTPSYLLRHPNKALWFIHHHRTAYDLWGTRYQDIPDTPEGRRYRDAIHSADNLAFREARHIFSNSQVVSDRLRKFNGVDSEVLYPPLSSPEQYRTGSYGDYVLYVSRLVPHKRQDLAIEAMRFTRTPARLVLAGAPDGGPHDPYLGQLRSLIDRHDLGERVTVCPQWIAEEEKVSLLAGCLACLYVPVDEDSYGYASLESHHARKAVITATDSGGVLELIQDGRNGFVVDSSPKAIAQKIDRLYDDRALAERMGEAAFGRIGELGIGWDSVVGRLLA